METNSNGIAIIGMTGRFPGAGNVDEFWRNLVAGVESVSFFSDEELGGVGVDVAGLRKNPSLVAARGVLKDADLFDAAFFNVSAKEAEVIDPQQRLFLEASWEALEDAGYDPSRVKGYIGVFAGMGSSSYFLNNLHSRPDVTGLMGEMAVALGNEKDFLATRVAYKLNLRGPAISTHAACSTSLVTVCQACHALLGYQCDLALAGGVSVSFPQKRATFYQEGGIFSPDGHCRPFDAQAGGTYFSDGLGVVVLKRLAEAIHDGDQIYAVIRGVGLNNDGAAKVGYTAPSVRGQAEVIALALAHAEVEPGTISYVETHGTATPLGDPIEIAGLTQAFRAGTSRKNYCAIGSVKSNVGHLVAAAGVAGLIKTVLALKHRMLPPSLNFSRPNPKIDFANSPFFVNSTLTEWKAGSTPRRAGVSAFGVGGTNAHVVLEEAPVLEPSGASREWQLLLLSAKTRTALDAGTANLVRHFKANPDVNLADAAFTLQEGRQVLDQRQMLVCHDLEDAAAAMAARDPKRIFTSAGNPDNPPVVFMFPGQGAQYVNMGADLYRTEAVFKQEIDRCAEMLLPGLGLDLREALYPAAGKEKTAEELLLQTRVTQPALFVISYALARLWMSWGIQPRAMIGHSVGEYVAACLAGVFSLPDALKIVAGRAKLVQAQPGGSMLAVRLPEAEVEPLLIGELALAAINSPTMCVVSGPTPAIERLEANLTGRRVPTKRLPTSHAFHSAMMDPVVAPLIELLGTVRLQEPAIPYVSNVTGRWVTGAEARDPGYWAGHVRQAVRFADGMAELAKEPERILLEVGPGQSLGAFARQHTAWPSGHLVLASFPFSREHEQAAMLTALGKLWMAGVSVDWDGFYKLERRRRVALPTYPFERKRFWVEPAKGAARPTANAAAPAPAVAELLVESNPSATPQPAMARKDRILKSVAALFQEISGTQASDMSPSARFTEMGLDSLLLAQASQMVQKKFGIQIAFRRLLDDLSTLNDLAGFLDQGLPSGAFAGEPAAPTPPETTENPVSLPMTESQKELWLAAQAGEDASCALNQMFSIHLRGRTKAEAIHGMLQQLVERHDALRTTFASDGSSQKIAPDWKIGLPTRDISGLHEADQERELAEAMKREDRTPFDLAEGPLIRAQLFKLSDSHCVLALAAHHIVLDGWSMGVLLREFSQLYDACEHGTRAELAPAMQYREYVQWQHSAEHQAAVQGSEDYWVKQFSNRPNNLELPADRARPSVKTYRAAERQMILDSSIYQSLKQVAAAQDCTLFVLLLASLKAWLFRLSGEADQVIGVPAAGQPAVAHHPGSAALTGHCVNTLPVRIHCDGNARFAEHLSSVKRVMLDAHEHQSLTLGSLVRKLNLPTDLSRAPLVPLVFNLGRHSRHLRLPTADIVFPPKSFFFFDLGIEAHDTGKDIRMVCRYNADLFDDARIGRMLNQYQTLLKAVAENPDRRLMDLPLLTDAERQQLLVEWNPDSAEDGLEGCVHQLFEMQAGRGPDSVAVVFEGQKLSYRQLNQRSNQLACALRKMGVGPETLVGVYMERSLEMVIAILGILKAGGAYLPLDPVYPRDRLAFMLEDARPKAVLTQKSLRDSLPDMGVPILALDADPERLSGESVANLDGGARLDNLAYVIYTSGSTGKPKGTLVTHRNVARLFQATQAWYHFGAQDVWTLFHSHAFDFSVWEIWGALAYGGRLVVVPYWVSRSPDAFWQLLCKEGVTVLNQTPSAFRQLIQAQQAADPTLPMALRFVIFGGEALEMQSLKPWFDRHGDQSPQLVNMYGITETTVHVTYRPLTCSDLKSGSVIGIPIPDLKVYILDRNRQPVPVGVPGELYVGGAGVARGYLNRPELTAEKFMDNPFIAKKGQRLYRSGDLARYLPNRDIEYLGRIDDQVKIRGFRIELGEIESVLAGLPGVREAVVLVREDNPGDKRLAAYLTCKDGEGLKIPELRGLLKAKLPEYMAPSAFVILDRLPLTPNGKVDRKALPKPDLEPAAGQFEAPRTQTEIGLANIWSEVLGMKQIGLRDNFFELGGHSLLATKMISRVRDAYHIDLALGLLFQNPTLTGLARVVDQVCAEEMQLDELSRIVLEIEGATDERAH